MYRILVCLQFVHVIALVDLFVITYMRFDYYGRVCFSIIDDPDQSELAIPIWLASGLEIYIAVLWSTVLIYLIAIIIVLFIVC